MREQDRSDAPVAIIGFGIAGVNAAIALRNASYDGAIQMFTNIDTLPYSPILTSYYASGEKTYDECFPWSEDELGELNLELVSEGPVIGLDPEKHVVITRKQSHPYSKCVIASGATPMCWGFPAVDGDPDYKPLVLRSMEDARRLKTALSRPTCRRLLVSGASMVALKTLEAGLRQGLDCTLVGINEHVLDFNALPAAAERFERGLLAKGVALKLGQRIESVKRVDDGLQVTFSSGDVGVYDEISVAHGMKSNIDFMPTGSIEIDKAIIVDEFMRTSNPDVYAAGDVAQATELISNEKRVVGIWKNAALQGACAGTAIAHELSGRRPPAACSIAGSISTNTIAVDGPLFISAGTMDLTESRTAEMREDDEMTIVCIFENERDEGKRLVGFNITCDNDEPGGKAYDIGAMLTLQIEAGLR